MHNLLTLLAPFVCLVAGLLAQAAEPKPTAHPFLWRIVGATPNWLYGTIHLPDPRIKALPAAVEEAIAGCDTLFTEIEFGASNQAAMVKATALPKGKTLADVLPEATHKHLLAYLQSKKVPQMVIDSFAANKPWALLAVLPMLDDLRMLMSGDALDAALVRIAKQHDKSTAALETIEEQLGVFGSFTDAEVAKMLDSSITLLEDFAKQGRKPMREMIEIYLSGDLAALSKFMDQMQGVGGDKELEDRLMKKLLDDRNQQMVERIRGHLKAEPGKSHFFAVGTAHYFGERGILALLAKAGVKVERVGGEPPPFALPSAPQAPTKTEPAKVPVGAGRGS